MVNRAEMAFITLSSLMQSHSHRGCPFYPATSSLGLIQNAAWRLLTFDRQSGRLPRHHEKKGMGKRVRVNSLDENLWMVMGYGWAHTLLAALGTRWKTREMCEKQLRFESYLHCFSQYLGGNFGTIYLVILRNCRQSVNTPKWNRFVSIVVSVSVLFLGKPIKDEALMGSFHARLHNGKAKVLLDLTKRVSQVELHPSTISN